MLKPLKVLSIDGGGIRGVIPAMVLATIESLTGKPVAELFDLIAGTSTGGILALALAKPDPRGRAQYSAADVVSLYEKHGRHIFHEPAFAKILSFGNLLDERYPSEGIEAVLDEYFGETPFSDALIDVLITSYETERRFPFFFKSRSARRKAAYDFPMKAVARATSAAPTYFEPLKLATGGVHEYYSLIDGGVYANNPALCGYVETKTFYPELEDVLIVSLGTGELTRPLRYEDARSWGLAGWAKRILDVVLDGVSSTVDYQLRQLLPPGPDGARRYWRFQVRLHEDNEALDDARPRNIRALKLLAEALIRDRSDDLKLLCERLVQ
jgi:uncharacterized protein